MPKLNDMKETALYVDDIERAKWFYQDVMGLGLLLDDPRICAFDVGGRHVLLICARGKSNQDMYLPGGMVPAHDGSGALHAGFAIDAEEFDAWKEHFQWHGVEIVSEFSWPAGGRSIYFRDPDGHTLELLTPGVWRTY